MQRQVEKRFASLWERLRAQGSPRPIIRLLIEFYGDTIRKYHNLEHIVFCLQEFDKAKHLAKNADAVEFALFFHDAIYNTKSKSNEYISAHWAFHIAEKAKLPMTFCQTVSHLILATKHDQHSTDPDTQLICDIDLASLGKEPSFFDIDGANIRQEYAWVPQAEYSIERSRILQAFLDRPAIYQTRFFGDKYETIARNNLQRAIANLLPTRD